MTQLLTHSRIDAFKVCRRKHWFSYEMGIRRESEGKALRMGSAFHDAVECLANTGDLAAACQRIYAKYEAMPDLADEQEWTYERETVLRLVCGYEWRWSHDELQHIAPEREWRLPLLNPQTGHASKTFDLAGKIDDIVGLPDGRIAVMETKLLSEELDDDSPLWKRLRIDHQISMYVNAARRLGYSADCVLYNVARKPTIKPTEIAILDDLGCKVVLDAKGERVRTQKGIWRQTGDKEQGYVLQTRPMTAGEWGDKLSDDIASRPDWYFARKEIPRLDVDLERYEAELWDIQKVMRDAQLNDRHYRTCNKETCAWCGYFDMCSTGWQSSDALPEGFVKLVQLHPELDLGGLSNGYSNAPAGTGKETEPATCAATT